MSFEEKSAWIMGVVAVGSYCVYLAIVLGLAGSTPVAEVRYVAPLLWTIGASIGISIALNILVGIFSPKEAGKKDQRDREIYRFGEYIGQSFVVIGGVAALLLAMAEVDHFWIANVIYLTFVLSAILGSVAKIVAYRRGFQPW
jgi:cell division protein FtsW (lipid II flippase)